MENANQHLIDGLNHDLEGEYQAIIMYTTYAASVNGPHRPALKAFFSQEIGDELIHAQFLAQKVASLGGQPTTQPRAVPEATTPKEMLENVLLAEEQAIAGYRQRAKQAEDAGDKGLSTRLETIVEDETEHREETLKILRGWE
jgi:bacterioferritin